MTKRIIKVAAIHIFALLLVLSKKANALDYDVDWPTSISGKQHTLRITINKCTTLINIKDSDLEKFAKSSKALDEVLEIAIKREKNGCK